MHSKAHYFENINALNKFLKTTKDDVYDIRWTPVLIGVEANPKTREKTFEIADRYLVLVYEE